MPLGRNVWITLGLIAVIAVAGVLLWRAGGQTQPSSPPPQGLGDQELSRGTPSGEGFNVLLISIDTLRADHLACYGHPDIKTPHIDRLAAAGTLFLQCTSSCPLTLPSHSTMLTGTYPFVHGARDNGAFHLHANNLSLAEVLQSAGYATAAEIAAFVLNREFGTDQGFDVYNDVQAARQGVADAERRAEDVSSGAIQSLRDRAEKRFFLFVHFFDPHFPYEPPPPFAGQYDDPYVGEIAYTDEQIGRLLEEVRRLGLEQKTLVILTSDHGEGRGQHAEHTHGTYVYDTTLWVPLIFSCPSQIPAAQRVAAQVRLVDLAPTVLSFLGMEPLPQAQGTDLLPLMTAPEHDPGLAAYAESMQPYYNYGFAPLRALRKGGWKYIHAPRPQIYHVAEDPGEERSLAGQEPERVARMSTELRELITDPPVVPGAGVGQRHVTPGDLRRLAGLGYVGSVGQGAEPAGQSELELFDATGPDPHDHAEEIDLTTRAMRQMGQERFEEAEQLLRELLDRSTDPAAGRTGSFWVLKSLGFVLSRRDMHTEAAEYYRRALELRPDHGMTLTRYATSLAEAGEIDEALSAFERAMRIKPILAITHKNYAVALSRAGRVDEAIAQLRRAIAMEPKTVGTRLKLAQTCLDADRVPEAIATLRRGLDVLPNAYPLRAMLADALLQARRPDQAKEQLEVLLKLQPSQPVLHLKLAQACMQMDQPAQAAEYLRQAVELDPGLGSAWHALAIARLRLGQPAEAVKAFESGLATDPDNVTMANDLAWLYATSPDAAIRDGAEALRLAQDARTATDAKNPNILDTLAAALADVGRFDEAVAVVGEAIRLAGEAGNSDLVDRLTQRRELYRNQQPYRMKP